MFFYPIAGDRKLPAVAAHANRSPSGRGWCMVGWGRLSRAARPDVDDWRSAGTGSCGGCRGRLPGGAGPQPGRNVPSTGYVPAVQKVGGGDHLS
jgi:hypothetical protein